MNAISQYRYVGAGVSKDGGLEFMTQISRENSKLGILALFM